MSSVPSFVSELVRSANETDRLTDYEAANLLRRSITVIRDLREAVGIPTEAPSMMRSSDWTVLQRVWKPLPRRT